MNELLQRLKDLKVVEDFLSMYDLSGEVDWRETSQPWIQDKVDEANELRTKILKGEDYDL